MSRLFKFATRRLLETDPNWRLVIDYRLNYSQKTLFRRLGLEFALWLFLLKNPENYIARQKTEAESKELSHENSVRQFIGSAPN